MKLIIGLGNPGKEYERTRHNIGFWVLDNLCEQWGFPEFSLHKKFDSAISEGLLENKKVMLVKPETFMNLSGTAVRKLMDFYKLTPEDILVIQDEIDLPFGTYRIATDSSSAGHNGIKNIIEHLGTQTFRRIRIGIKPEAGCPEDTHHFVLGQFSSEEQASLENFFPQIETAAKNFLMNT